MMKRTAGIAAALLLAVPAFGASAMTVPKSSASSDIVQPVASWRYYDRCAWTGRGWSVDLGNGRIVVCRPNRPGRNWA